jgi:hypothetical protein
VGCDLAAPADFWNYDYHNIPRPLWPWDELDDLQPSHSAIGKTGV